MNRKKQEQSKPSGLEVVVNHTGDYKKDKLNFDHALRDFKKKIKKSGLMNDLRNREAYMSPSAYKRWRKNEAVKRKKRDEKKQDWSRGQTDE